jgi:hypothetical protein
MERDDAGEIVGIVFSPEWGEPPLSVVIDFRGDHKNVPDWRRIVKCSGREYVLESCAREGKRQDKMVRAVYRISDASLPASETRNAIGAS